MKTFYDYIAAIKSGTGYKNISKLQFLQPDGSVAFTVGSYKKPGIQKTHDTRAFLQDGTLNISLKNGMRRKATVTFANTDEAFSFNVNNIWFGTTVRLLMGIKFPDDDEVMFSQGVFVVQNPSAVANPTDRTITYELADKWANLNGDNGGAYDVTHRIPIGSNIFDVMRSLLQLSRYTFEYDGNTNNMFDNVEPRFTEFYNGKRYWDETNQTYAFYTSTPYEIVTDSLNGSIADTLLELNNMLAGWIGYDASGALFVDASQDDISDVNKPVMWTFTPKNSVFCGMSINAKTADVKNDVIISSEDLSEHEIWGRASNYDDRSDTNINLIGRRTYRETKSTYWSAQQCTSLAQYEMKRRTVLQKSVTIECAPMYHLNENEVIQIMRPDKQGSPTEKHLIQSITIPIAETGSMQINATSVNDIPEFNNTSSDNGQRPARVYTATVSGLGSQNPSDVTFTKRNFNTTTLGIQEITMNGDTFIKIPTLYRKVNSVSDGQITSFTMANGKIDNSYKPYPCFLDSDGTTVLPYVLIGKYCSSSTTVMNSVDATPATMSLATGRTNARALGTGYQLYDWQIQKLFVDLSMLMSERVNFQNGSTTISEYLGIAHMNQAVWVDGIYHNNETWYAALNPANYVSNPSSSQTGYSALSYSAPTDNGYEIKALGYDNNNPFVNYPSATTSNSSYNTYYCDGYYYSSSSRPIYSNVGSAIANYGLWNCNGNGDWSAARAVRLCYRPIT